MGDTDGGRGSCEASAREIPQNTREQAEHEDISGATQTRQVRANHSREAAACARSQGQDGEEGAREACEGAASCEGEKSARGVDQSEETGRVGEQDQVERDQEDS